MTQIIPGVQVKVVKEVLPQQLSPSGVLGLIGFIEKNEGKVVRASSWTRFLEIAGAASAHSLPEARQALDNGVYELVIVPLSGGSCAEVNIPVIDSDKRALQTAIKLTARAPGSFANGLSVKITHRANLDNSASFDIEIKRPGGEDAGWEIHRDVKLEKLQETLKERSSIVRAMVVPQGDLPVANTYPLAEGTDANLDAYQKALLKLEDEADVDMVIASVPPTLGAIALKNIYESVISHCNRMSSDCKGRIGFGQVPISSASSTVNSWKQLASNLVSDRFVLAAPNGVVGAVAGKVGALPYFHSPTFKAVTGTGTLQSLVVEDQRQLLGVKVVHVVLERGKGVIILRGLTTDGDQISVRRVADHAVRVMKMVGDLFIGLLNNSDGRSALKQKLVAELLQMEKDGAIVPSTDEKEPAFKVEVYSSQADFAKGIVRVNMAVRPVRAIDFIEATITIQI